MNAHRLRQQILVIGLAFLFWSLFTPFLQPPFPVLLILGSYLLALTFVSAARNWVKAQRLAHVTILAIILAVPALSQLWLFRYTWIKIEGLHGIGDYLGDRLRLQTLPAIAPSLVVADRPQSYFVFAPGTRQLELRLGSKSKNLPSQSLGGGLFRVDYDPLRDGAPSPADGTLKATITTDGKGVERELTSATPLAHPRWLSLSTDLLLAATSSEETDEIVVVSRAGLELQMPAGDGPTDCAFIDGKHLAVTRRYMPTVLILDATSGDMVAEVNVGSGQIRAAGSPGQKMFAVAIGGSNPAVTLIGWPEGNVLEHISMPAEPDWMVFGPDDRTLIVATRPDAALHRFQRQSRGFRHDLTLRLGRPAITLARSKDGTKLFVATTDYDTTGRPQLGNHFIQDQILTVEVASMRVVHRQFTARRSSRQTDPGDVDQGVSPMGIAEGSDGALLVAFAGTDEAWRIRTDAIEPEITNLAAGPILAPHGIAELADGTVVLSSPSQGLIGILPPHERVPRIVRLAPDDSTLSTERPAAFRRRMGERAFYEATRSGISCQSCHSHADSDESAYNLDGYHLNPILTVRGLLHTAPYLRGGTDPNIANLHTVAKIRFRGYLRGQASRGELLETFIESLSRRENPTARESNDIERQRRGLQVFVKARCATCHAFPAFTALGQMPMGMLFPEEAESGDFLLDTPSLLSIAATPPYLSDGRAGTLDEVIGRFNKRNLHGDTQSLDSIERDELIVFLRSL